MYKKFLFFIIFLLLFAGCLEQAQLTNTVINPDGSDKNKISNPIITPESYAGESAVDIRIESIDGSLIYYTLDGSDPNYESAVYSGIINISETTTIKAFATKDGFLDSDIVSADFIVNEDITNNKNVKEIKIYPNEPKELEVNDTIQFYVDVLDQYGEVFPNYSDIVYEISQGSEFGEIDSETGLFIAKKAGTVVVRVVANDGIEEFSSEITIYDNRKFDVETLYAGEEYLGRITYGENSPEVYQDDMLLINKPETSEFEADGFFTIEGNIMYSGAEQYAWIVVSKGDSFMNDMEGSWDSSTNTSYYFVRGNFSQRIWMRYGAGKYTIEVMKAEVLSNNLNYEGDITNWRFEESPRYKFVVNNTREEEGVFFYPSNEIQSDNQEINAKAVEVINKAGAMSGTIEQKAKALYDYTVGYLYYDTESAKNNGNRRKQDTLSIYNMSNGVLTNPSEAMAVCDGYVSLFTALLRSQGIKTKAMGGTSQGQGHAWTAIWDGDSYKLADPTWGDPASDNKNPTNISYTYWWKDSFDGTHLNSYERPQRSISIFDKIIKEDGTVWYSCEKTVR